MRKKSLSTFLFFLMFLLGSVVVFAGPCEDGCLYEFDTCKSAAIAVEQSCITAANNNRSLATDAATASFQNCIAPPSSTMEQSICNVLYQMELDMIEFSYQQEVSQCSFLRELDETACNNSYEFCFSLCSVR